MDYTEPLWANIPMHLQQAAHDPDVPQEFYDRCLVRSLLVSLPSYVLAYLQGRGPGQPPLPLPPFGERITGTIALPCREFRGLEAQENSRSISSSSEPRAKVGTGDSSQNQDKGGAFRIRVRKNKRYERTLSMNQLNCHCVIPIHSL
jgi:hypothetical protein